MKNSSTSMTTKGRIVVGQLDNEDDPQCKCPAKAVETQTLVYTMNGITWALLFLEDNRALAIKIRSGMPFAVTTPHVGIYPREIATQIHKWSYLSIACNLKK